jgi:hypothetical protein
MIGKWIVCDRRVSSVGTSFEFDLDKTSNASGTTRPFTVVTNAPIDNTPADNLRSIVPLGQSVPAFG